MATRAFQPEALLHTLQNTTLKLCRGQDHIPHPQKPIAASFSELHLGELNIIEAST